MVVDLTVPGGVSGGPYAATVATQDVLDGETLEELIDLVIGHLLPELREDVSQLSGSDEPVAGLVKHLETFDELVYG